MVYKRENVLVIESKKKEGCHESIFETVTRKTNFIRPVVLNQFLMIGNYIDREFIKVEKPPKTNEEIMIFIKNLRNDLIMTNPDLNIVSQLKMFATSQLAEQWTQRWSGEMSPELFTESEVRLISPPRYSSMSPMHDEDDFSQARAADEDCGIKEFLTQATWAPTKTLPVPSSLPTTIIDTLLDYDSDNFAQDPYGCIKSYRYIDPSPTSPAVDENDGPTSFNHSPSILDFTGELFAWTIAKSLSFISPSYSEHK
ncbi:hypothetical protein QTP88_028996 [Uroleucon formosanum]